MGRREDRSEVAGVESEDGYARLSYLQRDKPHKAAVALTTLATYRTYDEASVT